MKTIIIAEAGVNHNGNMELARKMIDAAKEAGADIVKFQTGKPENNISRFARKADYQAEQTGAGESQFEMVKKLCLEYDQYVLLKEYCDKIGIQFLSTPFDPESVRFLDKLQNIMKIPSGEITNYPYLVEVARTHKEIFMSTGMCTIPEIRACMDLLKENGAGEISLLHCNTEYPTPFGDVNLRAMLTLRDEFQCRVGYSDHTMGIEAAIAAVAMGAAIIEKHFTLDRSMDGPDQKSSVEPDELKQMVCSIRHIEKALGDGIKRPSESESKNIEIVRKSIVARREIKMGEVFTDENIAAKRPGTGISAMRWNEVIGKKAIHDFGEDEMIEL